MQKKLISLFSAIALAVSVLIPGAALAVSDNFLKMKDITNKSASSGNASAAAKSSDQGNATSSAAKVNKIDAFTIKQGRSSATSSAADDNRGSATSTDANAKGQLTAETHRSSVASFVQSLLKVADREGGIGAEVRVIAQAQNNSASTSLEAIAKVENRGKLQTFLFGSDYKSLGVLRSELATTSANIRQLKNLLDKATSDADKAELSAQISALEESQAKIDAFVTKQASTFSLFGWLAKMFAK